MIRRQHLHDGTFNTFQVRESAVPVLGKLGEFLQTAHDVAGELAFGGRQMKDLCRSIFIIPKSARSTLSEAGWEFLSMDRIPRELVDALMERLRLTKTDSYLGMEEFSGSSLKAMAFLDDLGMVEHVHVRAFKGREIESELGTLLSFLDDRGALEVFIPGNT